MFEVQQSRGSDAGGEARQTPSLPKQVWVRSPLERGTEAGGWVARIFAGGLVGLAIAVPSQMASAHQTQISDGVGGTHHIEPNDTPRAGEPSQTWFALTQAGGTAIGLSDCDCELVLADSRGDVISTPALSSIAVEGLTDVPAAEVTFPQVGAYLLTMRGSPKGAADFPDFQLDFPVTVAAGQATAVPEETATREASPEAQVSQVAPQEDETARELPLVPMGIIVVLATAIVWFWRSKQH